MTKEFPHFSHMKFIPRVLWFAVFDSRSVQPVKPAIQVTTTIKSPFSQVNPNCKRKISGGFSIEKHLNQGTWHCLIPPFLEEIVKPGILPQGEADEMCIITAHRPINNHT